MSWISILLFLGQAAFAGDQAYDPALDQSVGNYVLDEANSVACRDRSDVDVNFSEDRGTLYVSNYALVLNESRSFDDIYDLHLLWEFGRTTARGRVVWKTQTTAGLLGYERDVKKFVFTDARSFQIRTWERELKWDRADLSSAPSICHYVRRN